MKIIRPEYTGKVVEIYRFLRDHSSISGEFPNDCCHVASRVAELLVDDLEAVAGRICSPGFRGDHGWNFDRKRCLYVDLTFSQLYPNSRGVLFTSSLDSRFPFRTSLDIMDSGGLWVKLTDSIAKRLIREYEEHKRVKS